MRRVCLLPAILTFGAATNGVSWASVISVATGKSHRGRSPRFGERPRGSMFRPCAQEPGMAPE